MKSSPSIVNFIKDELQICKMCDEDKDEDKEKCSKKVENIRNYKKGQGIFLGKFTDNKICEVHVNFRRTK